MRPTFLSTDKKESFTSWKFRTLMNWYPMYFGTGGKILFWAGDSTELHLRLKLNVWTYNYVGTIFGGSLFAAADPFYMLMLFKALGPKYVVWDKSANIRFKKPGKTTLYAKYKITEEDFTMIKAAVVEKGETTHNFIIQWMDKDQLVHAEIERQCYIAEKEFYQKKKEIRKMPNLNLK
jgi:acyl-coenzyme A thioesterase PaaI-like protein